jgi:hypothetical protein
VINTADASTPAGEDSLLLFCKRLQGAPLLPAARLKSGFLQAVNVGFEYPIEHAASCLGNDAAILVLVH